MLQNWKSFLQTTVGRFTGDTDILEGILALGIGVAAADGKIEKKEIETTLAHAKANALVMRLFTSDVIDTTKDKLLAKLRASPRLDTLYKELRDLSARDEATRHAVYAAGCAVAAHGGIDTAEQKILDECANILNLTVDDKAEIEKNATTGNISIDF